jgi:hypothetical protein
MGGECKGEAPRAERLWELIKAGESFEGKWLECTGQEGGWGGCHLELEDGRNLL